MKPPEDLIDGTVPPTLNHSLVVSVDSEMPSKGARVDEVANKPIALVQPMSHWPCTNCCTLVLMYLTIVRGYNISI